MNVPEHWCQDSRDHCNYRETALRSIDQWNLPVPVIYSTIVTNKCCYSFYHCYSSIFQFFGKKEVNKKKKKCKMYLTIRIVLILNFFIFFVDKQLVLEFVKGFFQNLYYLFRKKTISQLKLTGCFGLTPSWAVKIFMKEVPKLKPTESSPIGT